MDDDRRSQTDTDTQDQKKPHPSGRRRQPRRDKTRSSAAPVNETRGIETPAAPSARTGQAEQNERRLGSQAQGAKSRSAAEQDKAPSTAHPSAPPAQQGKSDSRGSSQGRSRRRSESRPVVNRRSADQRRSSARQGRDSLAPPVPRGYLAAAFDDEDDIFDDEPVESAAAPSQGIERRIARRDDEPVEPAVVPPKKTAEPKAGPALQPSRGGAEPVAQEQPQGRRPKKRPRASGGAKKPDAPQTSEAGPKEISSRSGAIASASETTPQPNQPSAAGRSDRGPTAKGKHRSRGKPPAAPRQAPTLPKAESDAAALADEPTAPAEPPRPSKGRPASAFAAMGLSDDLLEALFKADYLEPTPVQAGLIPRALAGADVMGQARTGTGKTAAFAIPILQRVAPGKVGAAPRALALVPTRELAVQVRDECQKLALFTEHRVAAVYGGKPIRQQAEQLRRGVDVLIGTPGRVIDMLNRGLLSLGDLQVVVLDEADRMLDIGFRPDIERILRRCPTERQTLLLSATIPPPVKRLAERYMRSPEVLDFSAGDVAVETIEQFYFTVDPERKFDLLIKLLEREQPRQTIVFVRTRRGADRLFRKLAPLFQAVDAIHGDLTQSARDRVMRRLREGKSKILVATDVVGRGIDVSGISHIINFDVPQFCDDYVHRVGRTGRMGREGVAFTFVTPEEGNELTRIEMRINRLLKRDEIPGFVALEKPKPTEQLDEPTDGPEPSKSVFGRPSKRYRRAL